jgi:hypothetical protein
VFERVSRDEGVHVVFHARPRAENRVLIQLASQHELPKAYADQLRQIMRDAMQDPEHQVHVITVRGMWRSDYDHMEQGAP